MGEKLEPQPVLSQQEGDDTEVQVEKLAEDRQHLLTRLITSRSFDKMGNWFPVVNAVKLAIESAVGRTSSNKKLNGQERIVRSLEAGALMLVYTTFAESMAGQSTSDTMLEAAIWSKFIANAAHIYLNKEVVKNIFVNFLESHPVAGLMFERIAAGIDNLPDDLFSNQPIQLNLR